MNKVIIFFLWITFYVNAEEVINIPQSLLNEVENGHAETAYFIATQYDQKSYENEVFYNKAKEWMQKAADMGYPQAMYELAKMLDAEKSEVIALKWFIKASEFGHAESLYNIANYHIQGLADNPVNCETAYSWYEKAQSKDSIAAYNDHAWSLATSANPDCRNPERALRVFAKINSQYQFRREEMPIIYIDTQAAIHASLSDFNKAIALQKIVVDEISDDNENKAGFIERLNFYKNRKVWLQQ
jgi:TPR repeat protein